MNVKETRDKVVNHVKRNKKVYITSAITGGTALALGVLGGMAVAGNGQIIINDAFKLQLWTTTTNNLNVYKGDPGNHVRCIETGQQWLSQGDASRELGISPTYLSHHLNGKKEHCKGLHLEVVGDHGLDIVGKAA